MLETLWLPLGSEQVTHNNPPPPWEMKLMLLLKVDLRLQQDIFFTGTLRNT